MVNLDEIIKKLNLEELKELKNELKEDSLHVRKIISDTIDNIESINKKVCAVCGTKISTVKEPLILYFGPKDLRKKAYFCGYDCLKYFLNNLDNFKRYGDFKHSSNINNALNQKWMNNKNNKNISNNLKRDHENIKIKLNKSKRNEHNFFFKIIDIISNAFD